MKASHDDHAGMVVLVILLGIGFSSVMYFGGSPHLLFFVAAPWIVLIPHAAGLPAWRTLATAVAIGIVQVVYIYACFVLIPPDGSIASIGLGMLTFLLPIVYVVAVWILRSIHR